MEHTLSMLLCTGDTLLIERDQPTSKENSTGVFTNFSLGPSKSQKFNSLEWVGFDTVQFREEFLTLLLNGRFIFMEEYKTHVGTVLGL